MTLKEMDDRILNRDKARAAIELLIDGVKPYDVSQMTLLPLNTVEQINRGSLYFDYKLQYPLTNLNNKKGSCARSLL